MNSCLSCGVVCLDAPRKGWCVVTENPSAHGGRTQESELDEELYDGRLTYETYANRRSVARKLSMWTIRVCGGNERLVANPMKRAIDARNERVNMRAMSFAATMPLRGVRVDAIGVCFVSSVDIVSSCEERARRRNSGLWWCGYGVPSSETILSMTQKLSRL